MTDADLYDARASISHLGPGLWHRVITEALGRGAELKRSLQREAELVTTVAEYRAADRESKSS